MSDYRHMNGNNYGNDYIPGPDEHFMGDDSRDGDRWIVTTYNTAGRNDAAKEQLKANIIANAPEGSVLTTHRNADGSETFVLKTPTSQYRR